jgi:hypothetical protein
MGASPIPVGEKVYKCFNTNNIRVNYSDSVVEFLGVINGVAKFKNVTGNRKGTISGYTPGPDGKVRYDTKIRQIVNSAFHLFTDRPRGRCDVIQDWGRDVPDTGTTHRTNRISQTYRLDQIAGNNSFNQVNFNVEGIHRGEFPLNRWLKASPVMPPRAASSEYVIRDITVDFDTVAGHRVFSVKFDVLDDSPRLLTIAGETQFGFVRRMDNAYKIYLVNPSNPGIKPLQMTSDGTLSWHPQPLQMTANELLGSSTPNLNFMLRAGNSVSMLSNP